MKFNLRWMRGIRVVFALGFFCLMSLQFFDVYHQLPETWYLYHPTKVQFIPSLLHLLSSASLLAGAAFLAITATTFVFGRAYCSFLCPLGILMDLVRWVVKFPATNRFLKKTRLGQSVARKLRLPYQAAYNKLRALAVGVAALLIALGYSAWVGFFEPYSLFGKVMGLIVYPALSLGTNEVSLFLAQQGNYSVSPVNGIVAVSLPAFGLALLILLTLSTLAAWRGRLYCNTVCPVGGFLGWVARFSLFRLEVDSKQCVSCGLCERQCKAQCIDSKGKSLDFTRCVLCFDCMKSCPKGGIHFVFRYGHKKPRLTPNPLVVKVDPQSGSVSLVPGKMSRRVFVRTVPALAALLGSAAKVKEGAPLPAPTDSDKPYEILDDAIPYGIPGTRPDKRLTLPPGAGNLKDFFFRCTGCQICVSTCKSQLLKPSITEWGLSGLMQPYMDFSKGFCVQECVECTRVCPSDALRPLTVEQKKVEKLGTAIFREDLCVVKKDETDCSACGEHCPVSAIEMLPYKPEKHLSIPYVHADVCIGCGACEYICPVEPYKALVVQGSKTITKAKEFDESMRLYRPEPQAPAPAAQPEELDNPFPF